MKKYILITICFLHYFSLQATFILPDVVEQNYKDVSVLVTGGCGFIGSHLVEKLVSLGAQVSVLDDLSSGNYENIAAVADKITFIKGSVADFDTCVTATYSAQIIFHLAAFISVPASTKDPHLCHSVNVLGTQNILEAARINNVTRIVFSSTCAVYGESELECSESSDTSPISPYGFSKLIGELYCKEYTKIFGLEAVSLRYFNVYGERQNIETEYAAVVAKFSNNMEKDLPLTIFGDGFQTRDFVPVEYVVNANLLCGICSSNMIAGEVFNIATGRSITLFELMGNLKEKYPNYKENIIFMPSRPGDIKHVAANCSKYNALYQSLLDDSHGL